MAGGGTPSSGQGVTQDSMGGPANYYNTSLEPMQMLQAFRAGQPVVNHIFRQSQQFLPPALSGVDHGQQWRSQQQQGILPSQVATGYGAGWHDSAGPGSGVADGDGGAAAAASADSSGMAGIGIGGDGSGGGGAK
jgi:hypothetical protein